MAKRNATPPSRQQSPNWQQKQQAQAAQRINHEMEDALSDVELKFIMNLPDTELQSSERLFFQIEQAHWYYEDFLADAPGSRLQHLNLRTFALSLFEFSELLKPLRAMYDEFFKDFMVYKGKIPTYGCILLNPTLDRLVLVCNWKGTSWGFPKGKLNEGEEGAMCAVREVEEETGYRAAGPQTGGLGSFAAAASDHNNNNSSSSSTGGGGGGSSSSDQNQGGGQWLPPEEDSITVVLDGGQRTKMFIVAGVPDDFPFEPQVRKEISKIQFFAFDEVPKKAWNVSQFLPALKRWVKDRKRTLKQKAKQASYNGGGNGSKNNTPPPRHPNSAAKNTPPLTYPSSSSSSSSGGGGSAGSNGLTASVASMLGGGGDIGENSGLTASVASMFGGSGGGDVFGGGGGGEGGGEVSGAGRRQTAPSSQPPQQQQQQQTLPPRAPPQKGKNMAILQCEKGGDGSGGGGAQQQQQQQQQQQAGGKTSSSSSSSKNDSSAPPLVPPALFSFDVADIMAALNDTLKKNDKEAGAEGKASPPPPPPPPRAQKKKKAQPPRPPAAATAVSAAN